MQECRALSPLVVSDSAATLQRLTSTSYRAGAEPGARVESAVAVENGLSNRNDADVIVSRTSVDRTGARPKFPVSSHPGNRGCAQVQRHHNLNRSLLARFTKPSIGEQSKRPLPLVKSSSASCRKLLKEAVNRRSSGGLVRPVTPGNPSAMRDDAPTLHRSSETAGIPSAETDTTPSQRHRMSF